MSSPMWEELPRYGRKSGRARPIQVCSAGSRGLVRRVRGSVDNRTRPAAISLCPLIGRDAEVARLLELWRSSRLVTLFGQSGAGKSALARAAADRLAEEANARVRCLDARDATTGAALLRLLTRSRRRFASQA